MLTIVKMEKDFNEDKKKISNNTLENENKEKSHKEKEKKQKIITLLN